jgi:Icc-related predicted phosphoesterase
MTRVLLVSDLHYTLPQWDWVVRAAPRYDLVVLAGDSLDISSPVPLDVQCVVILRYLALLRHACRVVVCSGNHDLTGPDERGEQAALWLAKARGAGLAADGDAVMLDDLRVTACPWWDGPQGRDALDAHLAREAALRGGRWAWVYHWPPMDSPTCWTGRRHYGDTELGGWIDRHQPDFVLAGHVHEPPFKPAGAWADRRGRTWVFNAGRQIGPVPAHIEIDLAGGSAAWHSLMGSESLQLAAASAPPRAVF